MAKDKKKERELKKKKERMRQEHKELQEKQQDKLRHKIGDGILKLMDLQEKRNKEEENYEEPQEIKLQEMPVYEKYPYFKLQVSYDVDHPEDVEQAQKSFYQALALLESTKVGAQILASFKNNYETKGMKTTINVFAGNAGIYKRTNVPCTGITNSFINEKLSGKTQHDPYIEIYVGGNNPEELAKLLSHELPHEQHNTEVLPMIFQGEKLDVFDVVAANCLTELFAYQQNRAYLFERFGAADSLIYNDLALHVKGAAQMHRSDLAEQTSLNMIQADINNIPVSEMIRQLPCMVEDEEKRDRNFLTEVWKEKELDKKRYIKPILDTVFQLAETQIPTENMTFEGKNFPQIFTAFLETGFPELSSVPNSFDLQKKGFEMVQDFGELIFTVGRYYLRGNKSQIDKLGEILVLTTGNERHKEAFHEVVEKMGTSESMKHYYQLTQGFVLFDSSSEIPEQPKTNIPLQNALMQKGRV